MTQDLAALSKWRPAALSRRRVLRLGLATALGFGLGIGASGSAEARPATALLHRRIIFFTGEQIPIIGLGTSDAFETRPGESLAALREVLQQFFALGGRLVDTSPTYGNAENVVGTLAAELGLTHKLFFATKVHEVGEEAGIAQMEASERLLRRRPLDLIQVHNLVDVETQLHTLREWKAAKRVRYIGITHYRVGAFEALENLMHRQPLDFVQFNYSILTPEAEQRLLPLAQEKGIAVLINRAFEDGRLFQRTRSEPLPPWAAEFDCSSWAQFALKYVISHPAVTCVIPATSKIKHLVDNMAAGRGRLPDAAQRQRMRAYMAKL